MLSIKYVSEEWCGPCKSFWPIVQEICANNPNVSLVKVGVEHPEVKDLQISSIPTVLFYKNGQLMHKSTGIMPKSQFNSLVDYYILNKK